MRSVKLLSLTLVALLSFAYAQTEVIWWDFLGGGDGVRMRTLIEQFNEEHPDITISPTTSEWGVPYYTRVQTSIAVGEGPDIMTYHTSRMPLAVPSGIFRPFSEEELASVGLSTDDYFPALVEAATFDGEFLCAPLDIHSHVLYYNRELLDQAGLIGDDGLPVGLDGLENFNAAMQTILDETGVLPLSHSIDAGSVWRIFYSLLNQQGADFVDENQVVMGEAGRIALQTMRDWAEAGFTPEDVEYPAGIALFTSGQAAMHFNGVWEVPTMVDLAAAGELFDWGAVAYPTLFDEHATWADSHCFSIPSNPPISEEKLEAVLEVISWMNRNSVFWATAGHIPAYLPVVESEEYQEMEPNATYAVLGETASFDPQSPVTGVASPTYDAVDNFFVPALSGLLSVDEAIEMFIQEIESQMR